MDDPQSSFLELSSYRLPFALAIVNGKFRFVKEQIMYQRS